MLWKTAIHLVAALLVRYIEHLLPFLREHGGLALAHSYLVEEVVWPHFWAVQIWLFVYFLMFCALRELVRVLGRDRDCAMFRGPLTANIT